MSSKSGPNRASQLEKLVRERILVLDGAMGTMVQGFKLSEADFRGERFAEHGQDLQGFNDLLVLTKPEVIEQIHRDYLEAGADIIETDTFNGTPVAMAEYGLSELADGGDTLRLEVGTQHGDTATRNVLVYRREHR